MKSTKALTLVVLALAMFSAACSFWRLDTRNFVPPPPTLDPELNDFGNAPDPSYPTKLASNGARTNNVAVFTLGQFANVEADARLDDDVDGVYVVVDDFDGTVSLTIDVCNQTKNPHVAVLNVLVDRNVNGAWDTFDEWVMRNEPVFLGARLCLVEAGSTTIADGDGWIRVMVSDTEVLADPNGWDGTGWYAKGEVEDVHFSHFWETPPVTITIKPPTIKVPSPTPTPTQKWIPTGPTIKVCAGTEVYDAPHGTLIGIVRETREGVELERSEDGTWIKIQIKDDIGWINSTGLAIDGQCYDPSPQPTLPPPAPAVPEHK